MFTKRVKETKRQESNSKHKIGKMYNRKRYRSYKDKEDVF